MTPIAVEGKPNRTPGRGDLRAGTLANAPGSRRKTAFARSSGRRTRLRVDRRSTRGPNAPRYGRLAPGLLDRNDGGLRGRARDAREEVSASIVSHAYSRST